ncbi:hypothetical protein THAOC_00580, partial [Thalassiosira oceanica]
CREYDPLDDRPAVDVNVPGPDLPTRFRPVAGEAAKYVQSLEAEVHERKAGGVGGRVLAGEVAQIRRKVPDVSSPLELPHRRSCDAASRLHCWDGKARRPRVHRTLVNLCNPSPSSSRSKLIQASGVVKDEEASAILRARRPFTSQPPGRLLPVYRDHMATTGDPSPSRLRSM